MIFPEDEEFLAHYGKKGMKWGVRSRPKNTTKSGYVRKTSFSGNLKKRSQLKEEKKANRTPEQLAKRAKTKKTIGKTVALGLLGTAAVGAVAADSIVSSIASSGQVSYGKTWSKRLMSAKDSAVGNMAYAALVGANVGSNLVNRN